MKKDARGDSQAMLPGPVKGPQAGMVLLLPIMALRPCGRFRKRLMSQGDEANVFHAIINGSEQGV